MTNRAANPKVAVSIVYIATLFMFILDSTVVNVALPTLRVDFHTAPASVSSVVTSYLVALAVAMPVAAWLGDRLGSRRVLLTALAVFTLASALCGVSQGLGMLIAFRALQGAAGGLSIPVGSAMLYRTYPPAERVRATRIVMVPTLIAPALGPVLGGLLVDDLSWRWIFYANLPIGLFVLAYGLRYLAPHRQDPPGPFDVGGFVLVATGFPLAMYALTDGAVTGWGSPPIIAAAAAAVVLLALFVRVCTRSSSPVLRLRLLADRGYRTANLATSIGGAGFLGTLFLVPIFLQNGLGFTALHSGLSTFTEAIGGMAGIQVSSRLFPRTGPRPLMGGGLAGAAVLVGLMAFVGQGEASWAMPVLMLGTGMSIGFAMAPAQVTALAGISAQALAQATTLTAVLRQAGSAAGVALVATCLAVFHAGGGSLDAYHLSFGVACLVLALGSVIGWRLRKSDALAAMVTSQPEPAAAA